MQVFNREHQNRKTKGREKEFENTIIEWGKLHYLKTVNATDMTFHKRLVSTLVQNQQQIIPFNYYSTANNTPHPSYEHVASVNGICS